MTVFLDVSFIYEFLEQFEGNFLCRVLFNLLCIELIYSFIHLACMEHNLRIFLMKKGIDFHAANSLLRI